MNDHPVLYKGEIPTGTYHQFCRNVYSQNGEDGILKQIFKELNIDKGYFCEFGASDGIKSSNTLNLMKKGWNGVLIEGNPQSFQQLQRNIPSGAVSVQSMTGTAILINKFICNESGQENSLDTILKSCNSPYDLDLLSIDIDRNDYYVWQNLDPIFQPKVVIIEVNSYRDPICEEYPHQSGYAGRDDPLRSWKPSRICEGTSFLPMIKLGLEKGYIPVSFTGNIIFVHKDYIDLLKEFPYKISDDPYDYIDLYTELSMWDNTWYTNPCLIYNTILRNSYIIDKRINNL